MVIELKEKFADELEIVSQVIINSIVSKEYLVEEIGHYLFNSGGKRIRPILTLLMSKICGYKGDKHFFLAAAVELIHAATLLHDDVVDESKVRRSNPTANFKWGNKASILVGDFLFSQSFKLMVKSESLKALDSLSSASVVIAEGEVMQLARLFQTQVLSIDDYRDIAIAKTGALFGASASVGAIISNKPENVIDAAKKFGELVGLIFQVRDDMLDYFADPLVTGKNLGDDLAQGNITLPIILAYNKAIHLSNVEDQKFIEQCFFVSEDRRSKFQALLLIMRKYSIEKDINLYVDSLLQDAKRFMSILPYDAEYSIYLEDILHYVMGRKN